MDDCRNKVKGLIIIWKPLKSAPSVTSFYIEWQIFCYFRNVRLKKGPRNDWTCMILPSRAGHAQYDSPVTREISISVKLSCHCDQVLVKKETCHSAGFPGAGFHLFSRVRGNPTSSPVLLFWEKLIKGIFRYRVIRSTLFSAHFDFIAFRKISPVY